MSFRTVAIVIGVNNSPGSRPLRNAENDARDLASFLAGPHGPVGHDDVLLVLGRNATRPTVEAVFHEAARRRPDLLFVVFSGHGGGGSIALADGELDHALLAGCVRHVHAKRAAVVIDACHAGAIASQSFAGLGEIPDESWQALLAQMLPGVRLLLASRADEVASDGQGRNGTFTQGLLAGLRNLAGDVVYAGRAYITAEALFRYAARFAQRQTNGGQTPVAFGPVADFAIARAQSQPIVVRPAVRQPQPAPSTSSGPGFGTFLILAAAGGLGAYAWSRRPKWDRNVERYRSRDGRFW
jgi:uncharacterized caspase-like protein